MESLYSRIKRKPMYQQDVQKRMGAVPWQRAVPNTRDIVQHHAGGMAQDQANTDISEKRLNMREHIHAGEMGLEGEQLNINRRQGRLAAGLGVANVGLQGLAGILQIREADKKAQMLQDAAQMYLTSGDMENYYNAQFLRYLGE